MAYPEMFEKCIDVILQNEGGYVWNKFDPGGETNMGIAKRFYPDVDIKNLTKENAIRIYFADYWLPMNLSLLENENLILHVFDMGVNAGIVMGVRILQRLVKVEDDGILGNITAKAANTFDGDIVDEYIKRRKLFYVTLIQRKPQLRVFIKGWLARIEKTKFKT